MSWEHRDYAYDSDSPQSGGLRSWFGGLPAPGRTIKWIMGANIALWMLCLFTGGDRSPVFQSLSMRTDLVLQGQVWRLVTFTYLHDPQGLGHVFFNMLGLYFLGMYLERDLGPKRFFRFYTFGGVFAVALYLLLTSVNWIAREATLVGASGNVLAVLGACAVRYPGIRLILVLFPVPIRTAVLIFTVLYAFNLFTRGSNAGGDACHLAGMAFGVAWGYRGASWSRRWSHWKERRERNAYEARRRAAASLQVEVDRILEKVHQNGIQSLTEREKKTLADATHKQQATGRR
ncbi:MAG: hypothetical protein HBSAPP02_14410 [Phycisphaerae bacterium]|nr:MAG: rhomboid family intramembrane serine protease [Planctomycetia bacterium]RIK71292.1 MAG: hypothetical protein DCC66_01515 [Planctomycetota bacterium]GJQ26409.1 MAG: hypothetical protein HBSAPP02_14410 [Phycisphaerae bacterium]